MKILVAAAMAAGLSACASTSPAGEAQKTQGVAAPSSASASAGSGWVSLGDGRMHDAGEAPKGLHVKGTLKDGVFEASSGVEGDGALATEGQPGWLELKTGKVHSDTEAVPPMKPYIKGFRAPDGTFAPSSREVVK